MVIKNEQHRLFILELMKVVQIPGHAIDLAYEVKKEVESAEVVDQPEVGND